MVQITATNQELVELFRALEGVKNVKGTRFSFIVAKNIKELSTHLRPLENFAEPSQEFKEVAAIAHKLAENEDKEGIEKLEEDNKDLIEQRKKQIEELELKMQEPSTVYVEKFRKDQLPEDLTTDQLLPLLILIDDQS